MAPKTEAFHPGRVLAERPMTRGQILVILLALGIALLDGYDLLSMSLVSPVLGQDWGIGKASVGVLLSSGLVGMALGSLGLSPLADRVGRKPVVLCGLVIVTVGMLACGLSDSLAPMMASRAFTGLGMGSLVSLLATTAAEFANARFRPLAVSCIAIGLPLGGAAGGVVTAAVLKGHDWHWVFLIGSIAGLAMTALVAIALPESPAYLISQRPVDALARLNRVMHRLGHDAVVQLPPASRAQATSYRTLFSPAMAPNTVRFIGVNLLMVIAAYYILNWLPQIMTGLGFSASTASLVSSASGLLGIAAPLMLGALAVRLGAARIAMVVMIGFGVALVALGFVPPVLSLFVLAACCSAFLLSGAAAIFQAHVVETFPAAMRASALGFIMGIGRIGSALGPYLAGLMFAAGMSRGTVSLCFAALTVAAGLLVGTHRIKPTLSPA